MLIGNYNHYLDMIRSVTGLNEARDGSMPDPNSLVGINKLAALNSNTATRHILQASLYMTRSLAECLSIRMADILEYADFKDEFAMQIGKYNLQIIEDIKDLYLYDFGIFIEMSPDEEEKAMLEQNIQMALSQQNISLEDAIDIREINNLKMANQLLKLKRKQKEEKEQAQQMQAQEMQAQQQMQAQEAAAMQQMQITQATSTAKMETMTAQSQMEIQKMQMEAQLKQKLMEVEFNYQMQLKGVEENQLEAREQNREDEKNNRLNKQSSNQSRMIEQRKRNLPSISFESNEDSLDGFDLSEFNPR